MSDSKRRGVFLALAMILILVRVISERMGIYEFQPYYALFFCLAFWRGGRWLALPFVAYVVSTIFMTGGVSWWMLSTLAGFGLIAVWGRQFHESMGKLTLLVSSCVGAVLFYVLTNMASWIFDGRYQRDWQGLTQALWSGLPSDSMPTWFFLRNGLIATALFTTVLLAFMRSPEKRSTEEVALPA